MLETEDIKKIEAIVRDHTKPLNSDIVSLKGDVASLKGDMVSVKSDISGLKADVFALKEDVAEIKNDTRTLETKIDKIQNSVDSLIKLYKDNDHEMTVQNNRKKNAEDWIDKAAPKLGIEFRH